MTIDRRISLQKIEIFRVVAEARGVSAAAESLGVSQPVVSAHLRSLEARIGADLVDRTGRRFALTAAGETVYQWAVELANRTNEIQRSLRSIHDGRAGEAVVAAGISSGPYLLAGLISSYSRAHPDVRLTLKVLASEAVIESVLSGESDLGILVADRFVLPPGVEAEQIGTEEIVIVVAPDHPAPDVVSVRQLDGIPLISSSGDPIRRSTDVKHLRAIGARPRPAMLAIGHPEGLKAATREGLGMSLMFRCTVADELDRGVLRQIRVPGHEFIEPVMLFTRRAKQLTPSQRALRDHLARV